MAKGTFVLDDETTRLLRALAARQRKPQSQIVREAVTAFAASGDRLSDEERDRKLQLLDRLAAAPPTRSAREVDDELAALRRDRRVGWRRKTD